MPKWQWQQAKNQLSELIEAARADSPQVITRHGTDAVAVLPNGALSQAQRGSSAHA